jgi:hypothetical protein
MAKWFPTPEETFVFRSREGGPAVTILVPGGHGPSLVEMDGVQYVEDEELTFLTRAHVRRAYEAREASQT